MKKRGDSQETTRLGSSALLLVLSVACTAKYCPHQLVVDTKLLASKCFSTISTTNYCTLYSNYSKLIQLQEDVLSAITDESIQRLFNILSSSVESGQSEQSANEVNIALQCIVKIVHALHLNPIVSNLQVL